MTGLWMVISSKKATNRPYDSKKHLTVKISSDMPIVCSLEAMLCIGKRVLAWILRIVHLFAWTGVFYQDTSYLIVNRMTDNGAVKYV